MKINIVLLCDITVSYRRKRQIHSIQQQLHHYKCVDQNVTERGNQESAQHRQWQAGLDEVGNPQVRALEVVHNQHGIHVGERRKRQRHRGRHCEQSKIWKYIRLVSIK